MAYIYSTGEILFCENAIKFSRTLLVYKSTKPVFFPAFHLMVLWLKMNKRKVSDTTESWREQSELPAEWLFQVGINMESNDHQSTMFIWNTSEGILY